MSSTQTRTLNLVANSTNFPYEPKHYCTTYVGSIEGISYYNINGYLYYTSSSNYDSWIYLNDAAKDILYPNATAKPIDYTVSMNMKRSGSFGVGRNFIDMSVNGSSWTGVTAYGSNGTRFYTSSSSFSTLTYSTSDFDTSAQNHLKNSNKSNCSIRIGGQTTRNTVYLNWCTFSLSFTRYDYSATAGTGVSSALCINTSSDSDSYNTINGYDGDQITFSCVVSTGYEFEGWYNGSTKVSSNQIYTHTVNGEDVTLIAKAVLATRTLSATYNGNTIINEQKTGDVAYSYGGISGTISANQTKTMQCNGKVCSSDIVIGGKTLQCNGELMASDVVINYS